MPKTVGFKLDDETHERLAALAEEAGKSPGELAREFVLMGLDGNPEFDRLRFKVASVENEVEELRKDLAASVECLLYSGGRTPRDEAKQWVAANLKRRE